MDRLLHNFKLSKFFSYFYTFLCLGGLVLFTLSASTSKKGVSQSFFYFLMTYIDFFKDLYLNSTFFTLFLYTILCALCTASALPLIGVLTFFGGFSFGTFPALFSSLIGQAIGSVLTFTLGSFLLKDSKFYNLVQRKMLGSQTRFVSSAYYLFILRIFPFIPSWFVSFGSSTLSLSLRSFLLATLLGKFPINLLYAWWGKVADLALIRSDGLNLTLRSHPELWWPFTGILILSFAPFIYKKVAQN